VCSFVRVRLVSISSWQCQFKDLFHLQNTTRVLEDTTAMCSYFCRISLINLDVID